ncbi:MAG: M48 family metallopeptidase [Deltaproteobacteria bacterium]|nr:M48 family metallopeptidase [Deltaproteobacteria bacterium]
MAAPHLYDQISRNKRNTYFLILGVIALFVFVGYLIGRFFYGDPFFGVVPALLGSSVYSLFSLFVGDKVVLFMMGAKPAEPGANQQLMNVVEEMAIAAGLKPPKVFVIHSPASNAFATGRSPDKASIAITTGLMERLNREELQAVIGHEMGHVKNFDTRFAILMAVLVGAVAMICDMVMRQMRFGGRRRGQGGGQLQIVMILLAVVLAILAPLVAKMIQFAMSRHRELLADNTAVELTRNPNALANALEKIATDPDELQLANRGTQHLFIVNPLRAASDVKKGIDPKLSEKSGWFDTHPPIGLRIRLLREMASRT